MREKMVNTIIGLLERSCTRFPNNAYLWEKRNGRYTSVTYTATREEVRQVAAGFMAVGLEKGDRVALLSEGCNDWIFGELGVLYAGGISVPLSIKLTEKELVFRINHSDARFLIVSEYYSNVIRHIEGELPEIERIFVIRQAVVEKGRYDSFERLKERGGQWMTEFPGKLEERAESVREDDVANISYTSGTTATPKGIMLTHSNYVCNVLQADSLIRIPESYKILLFLPWDHSFAHTVGIYSFMYNGASLASVEFGKSPMEYLRNISENMKEVKPDILLSVPALAKNFRKNIELKIQRKGLFVRMMYRMGLKWGYFYHRSCHSGGCSWKLIFYPFLKLIDYWVFAEIRKSFGGNLRFFVGGGALLDIELQRYYCTLGIPMYQGYGLSEASPVISTNRPGRYQFGSSGQPVEQMDLKICDENGRELPVGERGEIVIRGGNVMKGYWKNERSTTETLRDGWLYTGDMGYIDQQGLLYVLGRFKSLLIAGDGEKFSPEGIEEAIVELSPYIDYCVIYNNQSSYTAGLIVPNKEVLTEYVTRQEEKIGSVEAYKLMLAKINDELMKFRKDGEFAGLFPERWLPAVVGILPESLCEENGTINSASKIVRYRVFEVFQEELDFIYTPEGKNIQNTRNVRNIRKYFES